MRQYEVEAWCDNCGWVGQHIFKGGTLVSEAACPICNCLKLQRAAGARGSFPYEEIKVWELAKKAAKEVGYTEAECIDCKDGELECPNCPYNFDLGTSGRY